MAAARGNFQKGMLALALPFLCGCMQIDTHVKLNEDGSATITEKVRFSRKLLDLSGPAGSDTDITGLLVKETATARAAKLGKGCTLVSYDVADAEGGSKQSVAVYKIEDITELRYVSPYLAFADYDKNNTVKFVLDPKMHSSWEGYSAGEIALRIDLVKPGVGHPQIELKPGQKPPPGPAPKSLQMYRDLEPMFQDMLKDFKLKLRFECYDAIHTHFGLREAGTKPKYVDMLSITDKDLDKYGAPFFENEEVMLELIQEKFDEANIADNALDWGNNLTIPVFHNWGSASPKRHGWLGNTIFFRPSQHFFKKYFEGKTLDFVDNKGSHPKPANFDEIGCKPQ
jgi:hypothetical protein